MGSTYKPCVDDKYCPAEEAKGNSDRTIMYYVNDGVYGSFTLRLFHNVQYWPTLHKVNENQAIETIKVTHIAQTNRHV